MVSAVARRAPPCSSIRGGGMCFASLDLFVAAQIDPGVPIQARDVGTVDF
jgi:hypothetical protein